MGGIPSIPRRRISTSSTTISRNPEPRPDVQSKPVLKPINETDAVPVQLDMKDFQKQFGDMNFTLEMVPGKDGNMSFSLVPEKPVRDFRGLMAPKESFRQSSPGR